jgi:hypothetical protein
MSIATMCNEGKRDMSDAQCDEFEPSPCIKKAGCPDPTSMARKVMAGFCNVIFRVRGWIE